MKRAIGGLLIAILLSLLTVCPGLADSNLGFTAKGFTIFEGDSWTPELSGTLLPAEQGELTLTVGDKKIASVDQNGVITGLKKGQTKVTATLKRGKKTWKAQATLTVARRVTKVTLTTKGLSIYDAADPVVSSVLRERTEHQVIVMPVGKILNLAATCTPSDASSRKVSFSVSDEGVAKLTDRKLKAIQAGECDLTVASVQNPEITEVWHILVITPVSKITVSGEKRVSAGETLQLTAACNPGNATFTDVVWSSRAPKVASVDENGLVTGLRKGSATIEAKATDGSGKEGTIYITVTQPATSISLKETELTVVAGKKTTISAQVGPSDTDDKSVSWYSSDETIASVTRGTISGIKAGYCEITCVSNSNPMLSATVRVRVIQQVSRIAFESASGVSLPINTTFPLSWRIEPEDASIQDLTFSSSQPRIAAVDQNGVITGLSRGSATITASATDGSGKKGTIRVTVTQPVEGVSIQYRTYHIQLNRSLSVKALIEPSNANNKQMEWFTGDETIAVVRGSQNVGNVQGLSEGVTTVTGVTEDGGFSDTAEIRVADFNGAVIVEQVRWLDDTLWISLRNVSDFPVEEVEFRILCYDEEGELMPCHWNGEDTTVNGTYTGTLYPRERTGSDGFDLRDLSLGYDVTPATVVVYITGWKDSEGYHRSISAEEDQPMGYWTNSLPF